MYKVSKSNDGVVRLFKQADAEGIYNEIPVSDIDQAELTKLLNQWELDNLVQDKPESSGTPETITDETKTQRKTRKPDAE